MLGDIVFRVYGVHAGREEDVFFGAFRTRQEAERHVAEFAAKEMHGENWASSHHDQGFDIREHVVMTAFEIPPLPKPRDKYFVRATPKVRGPSSWDYTLVEVFRRDGATLTRVAGYERNYRMLGTFEPFRQDGHDLALISREYTATSVLDLETGEVIAEETVQSGGFCPVGFHVPDWWDVNDGLVIPGSKFWSADEEWPLGAFGFVWGCIWGDDSSWKVQHLDLRRVREGVLGRDERFGYVRLATDAEPPPWTIETPSAARSAPPPFIRARRYSGVSEVTFAVDVKYDLETGKVDDRDPFE